MTDQERAMESAMATSARPEDSARLTAFWSLKISTLTAGLPADVHLLA